MPNKSDSNTVRITAPPDRPGDAEALAWALVQSPLQAGWTMQAYLPTDLESTIKGDGVTGLIRELQEQVARVNRGKLDEMEALLVNQAYTLNSIFHQLARRAQGQQTIDSFNSFLKLALRAQNQCRATLETLSVIKNPPNVAFVRQANVAQVQQVNNGHSAAPPAAGPPLADALHTINQAPAPCLEQLNGNPLDTRTPTAASHADSAMATVAEIHRPQKRQRQG